MTMIEPTRMRSKSRAAAALIGLLAALGAAGCGNVTTADPHSQVSARESATKATCDRAQTCDLIGAGKTYETRSSCEAQTGSFWDQSWPPDQCDDRIVTDQLNVCLAAIAVVPCADAGSTLASFLVNCPEAKICAGAPDGGGN
jgi:hypothetical protein